MKKNLFVLFLVSVLIVSFNTGCKKTEIEEEVVEQTITKTVDDTSSTVSNENLVEGSDSTLLIVTDPWPPYIIENEDGSFSGFHTEVLREVLKELKIPSKIVKYPWERCIQMIKDKGADMIFTLNKNPERMEFMYFPDEPLAYSASVFFTLKGREDQIKYSSFEDLKGLRIGIVRGYSYSGGLIDQNFLTFDIVKDDYTNIKKLSEGRIDLWPSDKFVGIYAARVLEDLEGRARGYYTKRMGFLNKEINNSPIFVGLSKKAGNEDLAKKISAATIRIKNSPAYKKIEDSYTK